MGTRTKAGRPIWIDLSMLTVPAGQAGGRARPSTSSVTSPPPRSCWGWCGSASTGAAAAEASAASDLTRREQEILRTIAAGANRAMADRLHVSPATVRNHVQNILGKLGAHSRLEAAAYANRRGLV